MAKRVFGVSDFRYYAIADGIMALFGGTPVYFSSLTCEVEVSQVTGRPVKVRRGPATVTGDESRKSPLPVLAHCSY